MINLLLKRVDKQPKYTIGQLYVNNEYFCDTLEDTDRDLEQNMPEDKISKLKVYGQTAIPKGVYKIDMNTISSKFKDKSWAKPLDGKVPRLLNVPGFEGVLIHPGNVVADTYGCILVGINKTTGTVSDSVLTFNKLISYLKEDSDITLTIV